ncbi:MAG: 3-oxoacyl-ACP reductase FabG [Clostridia bacterium]|nr:3-oxoacyl-ACP reductase FabG [Clostridia bacterium]
MERVIFITGGSRGIGAECVRLFSKNGYRVAFSYLNSENEAMSLAKECGALPIKSDISDSSSITGAIHRANAELGGIDVLINNAGISQIALFTDITDEMWRTMIDTNLSGAFYATRAVLPQMISRKSGVILNVSSMWGQVGASCEVHYSVAKAGLIGMTKALAKEVGPSGIRVNCVSPGVIATDMNSHLSEDDINALKNDTPLEKIGNPSDIAEILLYLASNKASFITGQDIGVNGGMII